MGRLVARILGAAAGALVSVALLGHGVASADPLAGKTYDEAAAAISGWHGKAVIGTVSGNQLEKDDCMVASWQKSTYLNSSGDNLRSNEYVLHLNCNNYVATPGHPGNSVMTPQGSQGKEDREQALSIEKNPEWCQTTDQRLTWCMKICDRTGLCEI